MTACSGNFMSRASSAHCRRSPQYEKLAHDERRAPLDEEAAKPAESNGDGHVPATTLPISSDIASPNVRAAAPAAVPENLLTFSSVAKTGAVRCLQLDTEALISCREGLKSWCADPTRRVCFDLILCRFAVRHFEAWSTNHHADPLVATVETCDSLPTIANTW